MSRRGMLSQCANGFGAVALAALHADPAFTSAGWPWAAPYGSSKKYHLLIYGWWTLTSRHV